MVSLSVISFTMPPITNLTKSTFDLNMSDSEVDEVSAPAKKRVLCLHGWRTSAKIMSMQTAAMKFHTPLEYTFIDATFAAEGPPDKGISTFYPNNDYYEWYKKRPEQNPPYEGLDQTEEYIINVLRTQGPFDGILAFSQGSAMATRLAHFQEEGHDSFKQEKLFKFVILIGGVEPCDISEKVANITIPSLHIMGAADPFISRSKLLLNYYSKHETAVLEHKEGHNIPSMRTGLYPLIAKWINQL